MAIGNDCSPTEQASRSAHSVLHRRKTAPDFDQGEIHVQVAPRRRKGMRDSSVLAALSIADIALQGQACPLNAGHAAARDHSGSREGVAQLVRDVARLALARVGAKARRRDRKRQEASLLNLHWRRLANPRRTGDRSVMRCNGANTQRASMLDEGAYADTQTPIATLNSNSCTFPRLAQVIWTIRSPTRRGHDRRDYFVTPSGVRSRGQILSRAGNEERSRPLQNHADRLCQSISFISYLMISRCQAGTIDFASDADPSTSDLPVFQRTSKQCACAITNASRVASAHDPALQLHTFLQSADDSNAVTSRAS